MRSWSVRFFCFVPFFALSVLAAEGNPPEILVTTSNPFKTQELSTPVKQLSGDALLMRQEVSLGETLSGIEGVSSSYFGGAASRPIIRGLDGDRIRILNNGAAVNDVSGLSFDHALASDVLSTEQIEIVRGPATLMYGGSAVGGVVNMLDNRIAHQSAFESSGGVQGKAQVDAGSAGTDASALVETGTDRFALHVDAFTRKNGEVPAPISLPCTQSGITRMQNKICNSQANATGAGVGGSLFFDNGYAGASLQSTQQNYGSPAEPSIGIQMQSSRLRLEGEKKNLDALGGLVQSLAAYWVRHRYQHQELDTGIVGTVFKSNSVESALNARLADLTLGNQTIRSQLGWQQERIDFVAQGDESFVPPSLTQSQALYALEEIQTPWGQWSAGLRREVASVNASALNQFQSMQRRLAGSSYALGSLVKLGSVLGGLAATANFAKNARIPKDYELYANGAHAATGAYEIGDANLDVETSRHVELGLRWQGARTTEFARFNAYTTRYDNYIYLSDTGRVSDAGMPIYQLQPVPAIFNGWEWAGGTRLWQTSGSDAKTLSIEARLDSVQATQSATGAALPRIPPARGGIDWIGKKNAWTTRLGFNHTAAQNRVAALQPPTGSYTIWNASLQYEQKVKEGNRLWFAKLHNLTNAVGFPATSILTQSTLGRVPLPGRTLKLGVQIHF